MGGGGRWNTADQRYWGAAGSLQECFGTASGRRRQAVANSRSKVKCTRRSMAWLERVHPLARHQPKFWRFFYWSSAEKTEWRVGNKRKPPPVERSATAVCTLEACISCQNLLLLSSFVSSSVMWRCSSEVFHANMMNP